MFPKVQKQIKNKTVYRYRISQSCLFMHLIFEPFETGLEKRQTLKNIYISTKNVFRTGQYVSFPVIERNFTFS